MTESKSVVYVPESGIIKYEDTWTTRDDEGIQKRINKAKNSISTWNV